MRFIVGVFFLLGVCQVANASSVIKDSLLRVLAQESGAQQRCAIFRDLADLSYETPDEKVYLKLLIQEALKANADKELLMEAMANLAMIYVVDNQPDSTEYYVGQFNLMEKTDEVKKWITYMNMCRFNMNVIGGDGSNAIQEALKQLETQEESGDIYTRIQNAYMVANGLHAQEKLEQALPYAVNAEKLASSLPLKYGCKLHLYTIKLLGTIQLQLKQYDQGIKMMEKYIELQEKYYEQYYKDSRPYYYISSLRISAYAALMVNVQKLSPEKADYYFQKVLAYSSQDISLIDKYSCNRIMYNYYVCKQDLPMALAANDTLISYARIIAPYNLSGLYRISSVLHEWMGDYKESLADLKSYYAVQDSLNTVKAQEHLNQLQVKYDVNQLNYEKSQLEIKNKKILLICLAFILVLLVILCTYLYRSLRKERAMKVRLTELKAKAEESEKMKTLFIRSVCHEIRTPLNAIVGFSDLMCVPDIDEEMRQSFPQEIHRNSVLLTSLISRMLEVAELDVSNETLPVEQTDVHVVCVQSMERVQDRGKKEIDYVLEIPEEPLTVLTHTHYLMLVIENLLDNANKFTENGRIILHYEVDTVKNKLLISVTDTGCGIPVEMHEKVFERFSKLDAYKPGNGLGLYLCRLIVRRLLGHIYIDSTYSQGTRVWIELPM